MFAMLYSTRDFVIVYLIYVCCMYTAIMHTRLPAWALARSCSLFHSHKKKHKCICICLEQKLTIWIETIIVFVKCTRNAKRLESKSKCKWHDWIWNFLFQKAHFIRLSFANKIPLAFSFHMNKNKTHTLKSRKKNSFHLI